MYLIIEELRLDQTFKSTMRTWVSRILLKQQGSRLFGSQLWYYWKIPKQSTNVSLMSIFSPKIHPFQPVSFPFQINNKKKTSPRAGSSQWSRRRPGTPSRSAASCNATFGKRRRLTPHPAHHTTTNSVKIVHFAILVTVAEPTSRRHRFYRRRVASSCLTIAAGLSSSH